MGAKEKMSFQGKLKIAFTSFVKSLKSCLLTCYNPKEKRILHRTPIQFLILVAFMIACYIVFAGLTSLEYYAFSQLARVDKGSFKRFQFLREGLGLKTNFENIEYSLANSTSYKIYVDNLNIFFESLKNDTSLNCPSNEKYETDVLKEDELQTRCKQTIESLPETCKKTPYGYGTDTPCIIISMAKILNFFPHTIDDKFALVNCTYTESGGNKTEIMSTPKGFIKKVSIIKNDATFFMPFIALTPKVTKEGHVYCFIKDSQVYINPVYSNNTRNGNIKIRVQIN